MKRVRKVLFVLLKLVLLLMAFMAALWIFLPWREVGSAAMNLAVGRIEKQGMKLNFTDVTGVDGGFTVNNLSLEGFATVKCNALTLRPQLVASLLSLAPVATVSFQDATVTVGQAMNFGDGGFLLTAAILGPNPEILLEQLQSGTNGDFAVNGFLTINLAQMKIGRAEAAMRVPSDFESNMSVLQNFLPLVKQGDNWFLRRSASN